MARKNNSDIDEDLQDLIDPEEIISVNFEGLDKDSKEEAERLINSISRLYFDEDFIKNQPNFRARVDADIESIRLSLRMRKADEIAHDVLLKQITQHSSNASLYKALTELQRTINSITAKIEETVEKLSVFVKGYQRELNFEEPDKPTNEVDDEEDGGEDDPTGSTHRGMKAFIKRMSGEDEEE